MSVYDSPVEGTPNDNTSEHIGTTENVMDQRLDDLIAIADVTGATLDAVVATVGRLPEATFTAVIDVLSTLCAPPAPSDLQDLLQQHRASTDRIAEAETDGSIENLDRQIDQLEQRIMATPARSATEAYAKMLAIFPELWFDLQRPEYAALVVEIGGEVA
jgi:hypothetical protein